jgi:hypothetical protein
MFHVGPGDYTLADASSDLWDVDESDRFAKLAIKYPELLMDEEQVLWKLVRVTRDFWWKGPNDIDYSALRDNWKLIKQYVAGEIDKEEYDSKLDVIPF